ncbi:GNAT family N-acetyltransferase [Emticicia sp. CRIBPO]|uniref:GNAT family N-acetyltransferase n=1 Tax=Emticicia sp. CRIBPO TaxID=2683258 RepID=UPI0014129F93|nr:GNAT family N-acetyltransferase [Emticicia sp. CRIBPO]NBA88375.1 GNAT family N-acetyltransferase [Emticicia sp. CRIBPO]
MDNLQIKHLGPEDLPLFQKLIRVFHEVFDLNESEIPEEPYLENLLQKDSFVAFAALVDQEVAGGLTAYELPEYYSASSEIFIYDIAILPAYQRKGAGKELLEAIKEYARKKGITEVFVAAHEEDTHALDFYHSAGGHSEKAVHFDFPVKEK